MIGHPNHHLTRSKVIGSLGSTHHPIFEHMKTCWNELTGPCKKMASLKTPRLCRQRCHTQTRLVGRCLGWRRWRYQRWKLPDDFTGGSCIWVLNQKLGYPPKKSILTGFSMKYTIHFQVPLFLETPIYTLNPTYDRPIFKGTKKPSKTRPKLPSNQNSHTAPFDTWWRKW